MDSVVIGFALLTVFMSVGGAAGACVHVKNDDMVEYSCVGGQSDDLKTIPTTAEKIRISRMHIPIITADMFSRFGPALWVLSCSHCDIVDIEPNAFRSLVNLQQLSLDNNHLTTVKAAWFEGFEYLTYLDLNYNQITTIEDGVFENLPSLVDFRLSGNRFECLNTRAMENLQHLRRIFLSENPEFKCPNAISKFLDDRDVSFDRDPEWKDIDEVVPTDTTMVDDRRTSIYWSTTPPYRERLHLPAVVATTEEDTRSSYQVSQPERTSTHETIRYPLYAPVSVTTATYREKTSYPSSSFDSTTPVTTTAESDMTQYHRRPISDPYRPYVTTTPQPSRYPSTRPWPSVPEEEEVEEEEDDITENSEYYQRFGYSDEVSGTASLATSPMDRGGSAPLLDPRNTPSTQPPEIYWTPNGILIEPNYPLPNPSWDPRFNGDDMQTVEADDIQTFRPPYVPRPAAPELVQPAAPSDSLQVPYYEPTVTVRRPPPPPPPSVLQNYNEQLTTVAPLETTTDVPLPKCPNNSSPSSRTLSIKEPIIFILFIFIANIVV